MLTRLTVFIVKFKRLVITIVAVVALIAIVVLSHGVRSWIDNFSAQAARVTTSDSALLEESVRRVAQLATLSLRYTEAGVEEDQRTIELFGQTTAIPGTTRRMIVRWQGDILFGINAEEISINIVELDEGGREVRVTLPEAVIMSHAIDHGSVQVLDETTGIFARHNLGDLSRFLDARHRYINTRAETLAMLETAQANAQDSIYHFLRLVLDDDIYTIAFV